MIKRYVKYNNDENRWFLSVLIVIAIIMTVRITHSYEGLGLDYLKARTGIPGFALFMVSHIMPDIIDKTLPITIVELGVGSGQQTEFVEKELKRKRLVRYRILAYDKSFQPKSTEKPGQLNVLEERIKNGEISEKVIPLCFDFDGTVLPVESGSVEFSYMAHVFHHLKNKQLVLQEIARVTRPGGKYFLLGVTTEDLVNHPLNAFFPMKYEYDVKRYPTGLQMKHMFESAGFTYEQPFSMGINYTRRVDRAFLASIENTTMDSVLRMIKDNDFAGFQKGVQRIQKTVEAADKSGNYQTFSLDLAKAFWGIKR